MAALYALCIFSFCDPRIACSGPFIFLSKTTFQEEEARLSSTVTAKISEVKASVLTELRGVLSAELMANKAALDAKAVELGQMAKQREAKADEKLTAAIEALRREINRSKGSIFHVQMNLALKNGEFENVFGSAHDAIDCQIRALDKLNLRRVAGTLLTEVLPKLDERLLANAENSGYPILQVVDKLEKISAHGEFYDLCRDLRQAHTDAKNRKAQ